MDHEAPRPSTSHVPAESPESAPAAQAPALKPEEEPVVTGTLFMMLLFLMLIFGFWMMMYLILLNR